MLSPQVSPLQKVRASLYKVAVPLVRERQGFQGGEKGSQGKKCSPAYLTKAVQPRLSTCSNRCATKFGKGAKPSWVIRPSRPAAEVRRCKKQKKPPSSSTGSTSLLVLLATEPIYGRRSSRRGSAGRKEGFAPLEAPAPLRPARLLAGLPPAGKQLRAKGTEPLPAAPPALRLPPGGAFPSPRAAGKGPAGPGPS